jgi:hypothetical protein
MTTGSTEVGFEDRPESPVRWMNSSEDAKLKGGWNTFGMRPWSMTGMRTIRNVG